MPQILRTSLLLVGALLVGHAEAEPPAGTRSGGAEAAAAAGPTLSLRVDNDVLGGQDQGYSNGIQLRLSSGNLTVSLSQAIFTPMNPGRTDLITTDRPYAAALLLGVGYNARTRDSLRASLLQVGIVGPSARGRQSQNNIHKLTGDKPFLGWDNQLHDEGVFRLLHERRRRHRPAPGGPRPEASRWDAVTYWGAAVGNLATHADAGGELRWGHDLPDDFGSTPTGPVDGQVALPGRGSTTGSHGMALHGFASVDARWVLRDISLDGNTFQRSHRVDKEPVVADLGYGVALTWGSWRMVLARFHRTREFKGQQKLPVFGSITVSRSF